MGWIIAGVIFLFVVGSIMTLKPSGIDMRLDKLRMTARRLELNPKLIACPDWLRGRDDEYGKGMMGQYGIVLSDKKLPHVRYHNVLDDGEPQWRPVAIEDNEDNGDNSTNGNKQPQSVTLDKHPIQLPANVLQFVKGLEAKANSIVLYWEDVGYVRPTTEPKYDANRIETDLLAIKQQLDRWADDIK